MHNLIILRGNSGSGKTTVAKELQNLFGGNTMLISQDMVRREILKVSDGKSTLALPLLKELLQYGYGHSEVVILEGIMVADWYRPLFELAVSLYGEDVFAYYFDLPFEETVKRHKTRSKAGSFGEEAMKEWRVEKDYSDVLKETRITEELSKEQILHMIRQTISSQNRH
ncbi:MAG: kinase [Clostridiales bacterium]|nr:kinase [Clostridiales bacterium]